MPGYPPQGIGRLFSKFVVATDGRGQYTDLQSALNALPLGKEEIIYVEPGTYNLTTLGSGITFSKSNVIIQGSGPSTIFNFNAATIPTAFKMADATQRSQIHLRDFMINQNGAAGTGIGIDISHFTLSKLDNIVISGINGGILGNSNDAIYNIIDNPVITCSGAGAYGLQFANSATENVIRRPRILPDANTSGIIVNAANISIHDPIITSGAALGIDVQANGHSCLISNPFLSTNAINLQLAANVESPIVIGGDITGGTTNNINNLGAKGLTIFTRLNLEQFTHRESLNGMPRTRFGQQYHFPSGGTSQVFTVGATARVQLVEFELMEDSFIDGIWYTVGTTSAGNVTVGIYGPITTEETCAGAPVLVQSASTGQSASTSTPQLVPLTKTLAKAGRYYAALEGSDATGTYMRSTNQISQVTGWSQRYDRAGGYGTLTDPCPAITEGGAVAPALHPQLASLTTV